MWFYSFDRRVFLIVVKGWWYILRKLTLKQKKFADEYIISGNAYQAAIIAGYSKNYAKNASCKMVENGGVISDYISERLKLIESEKTADAKEVIEYLTSVLRGESTSEVVTTIGVGDGCSQVVRIKKQPDEKERLKAAELLGKRYGIYTDKVDASVAMNLQVKIDYEDD